MSREKKLEILPDKASLIERAAVIIKEKIIEAIAINDRCAIALSGGSTPKPLYEAISKESLPWSKIYIFWGDERYVPPSHPDSNQRMAREAWLERVEIPENNIYAMATSAPEPSEAAKAYEERLVNFFGIGEGEVPILDIVLLGMGDDGHTASLFPHTEALLVREQLVTVGNKDGEPRLTFSVPLINKARCVVFLVAGASKQKALKEVFAPAGDDLSYPSRLIQPEQGEVIWLLDQAAGAEMD